MAGPGYEPPATTSSNLEPSESWTPKASLAESLLTTQSANIEIEFVVLRGGKYLQPTVLLKDGVGNTLYSGRQIPNPELRRTPMGEGKYKSSMLIPADFLAPGTIFVSIGIPQIAGGFETHALVPDAVSFKWLTIFPKTPSDAATKDLFRDSCARG